VMYQSVCKLGVGEEVEEKWLSYLGEETRSQRG
jgi:hypothetical protein